MGKGLGDMGWLIWASGLGSEKWYMLGIEWLEKTCILASVLVW